MSQRWHFNVFSASCIFIGVVKLKSYGLHLLAISCLFKSSDCVKTLGHLSHLNGVCPLCVHSCLFKT